MFFIDDVQLKPGTATRVLITYWSDGYNRGPTVTVTATVRRRIKATTGCQSWQIQIDGRDKPSVAREIVLGDGRSELVLEL